MSATPITSLAQVTQIANAVIDKVAAEHYMHEADALTFTVKKQTTAETGYFSTYQLFSVSADETPVETPVGAKINIPMDFLVKEASIGEVVASDKAEGGKFEDDENFQVGDKYIDFVINVKEGSATDEHLYLNVKDLVDAYTAGNGITISAANEVSVNIDPNNARGLSTSSNGLALALVTPNVTTYVSAGAGATYTEGVTYYTDSTGSTVATITDPEVGVTDVSMYYIASVTAGADGAMSAADKTKLDSIALASAADVTAAIAALNSL